MDSKFPAPEWVHFSSLKNMSLTPQHYLASMNYGKRSGPMTIGTIAHALLLGHTEYVVFTGKVRRGKDWDAFEAQNEDKTICTQKEYDAARRIADSVMLNNDACLALAGAHEKEISWIGLSGRKCAGRVDVVGDTFITDFKTTRFAKPEWFQGEALRRKYHAQLAWYLDGLGGPQKDAMIVAVESSPPFAVSVFKLTPRALDEGRKQYHGWMEKLLQCEAANVWPGYCQSVVDLDVPEELEMQFESDEEEEEEKE